MRTIRSSSRLQLLVPTAALWLALSALLGAGAARQDDRATARPPAPSLARPGSQARQTGADGFIQRWLVLEPIRVPGQLVESAVRAAVEKDFPVSASPLPRDGDRLTVGEHDLRWHAVDTLNYHSSSSNRPYLSTSS